MISNLNKELIKRAKAYENVTLVPTAMVFDTDKGFNQTIQTVNPHTDVTDLYPDEGMHPGTAGYRQIGDEIYAAMCYLLESGKFRNLTVPAPGSVSANDANVTEESADIDGAEAADNTSTDDNSEADDTADDSTDGNTDVASDSNVTNVSAGDRSANGLNIGAGIE